MLVYKNSKNQNNNKDIRTYKFIKWVFIILINSSLIIKLLHITFVILTKVSLPSSMFVGKILHLQFSGIAISSKLRYPYRTARFVLPLLCLISFLCRFLVLSDVLVICTRLSRVNILAKSAPPPSGGEGGNKSNLKKKQGRNSI